MNHGAYNPPAHFHNVQRQYAEQTPLLASNRAQGAPPSNLGFESALSTPLSPMFSPLGSARSSHSDSAMSSRPYNPQRWGLNSNTRGAHLTFPPNQTAARESTGMERKLSLIQFPGPNDSACFGSLVLSLNHHLTEV
jgi:hypothetical protein